MSTTNYIGNLPEKIMSDSLVHPTFHFNVEEYSNAYDDRTLFYKTGSTQIVIRMDSNSKDVHDWSCSIEEINGDKNDNNMYLPIFLSFLDKELVSVLRDEMGYSQDSAELFMQEKLKFLGIVSEFFSNHSNCRFSIEVDCDIDYAHDKFFVQFGNESASLNYIPSGYGIDPEYRINISFFDKIPSVQKYIKVFKAGEKIDDIFSVIKNDLEKMK